MRMRLLTTAAALALLAAMAAPTVALAAGETPSSSSGATTGASTSTGGSLSEPAGVDSNATTPSVYAPSSPAGSAGSAGTGGASSMPSGSAASGPLGNSTSPTLAPSGISTQSSSSTGTRLDTSGTMGGSVPIGSTVGGPLVIGTQGLLLPPDYATGARVFYRTSYAGAAYETSVGGTEHARRAAEGEPGLLQGESRYEALAKAIEANAGDARGMADRNGTIVLPEEDASAMSGAAGGSSY